MLGLASIGFRSWSDRWLQSAITVDQNQDWLRSWTWRHSAQLRWTIWIAVVTPAAHGTVVTTIYKHCVILWSPCCTRAISEHFRDKGLIIELCRLRIVDDGNLLSDKCCVCQWYYQIGLLLDSGSSELWAFCCTGFQVGLIRCKHRRSQLVSRSRLQQTSMRCLPVLIQPLQPSTGVVRWTRLVSRVSASRIF